MKRILSGFILFFILPSASMATIQSGIDALINKVDPDINIGIEVTNLTTGELIYSRNPNRPFTPASNMKIFSNAAALMLLGPDYRFNNQLGTHATQLKNGVLKGNVYLHLPGDPSFSQQDVKTLFAALNKWDIKTIDGNIVIDSHLSAVNPYAPGWMVEDLTYSYGAPLAPVILDMNRITVTVNPAEKAGKAAIIEILDGSGVLKLNNNVQTKTSIKGCGVDFSMNKQNEITVRGCVGADQWSVQQQMAIINPLSYMDAVIKKQLADLNISFKGKITTGKAPTGTLLLAAKASPTISRLIADTLKPSENLYAESLYLHTAATLKGHPVNWGEAQTLIKNFLQQHSGIDLKAAKLADGSGLSRYDLLTPKQTVNLLRFLHERFYFSYEFIAALPVSGRDGTLQRRFNKPTEQGFLRAKTGTMTGVISLSGYLYTTNGHTLAFAIYINNLPGTRRSVSGQYRSLVDALCVFLLKQKPSSPRLAKIALAHKRMPFQQTSTQATLQRKKQFKWRQLETAIKTAFKGKPVSVLFRGRELELQDFQNSAEQVWTVLESLHKKYAFTTALQSEFFPRLPTSKHGLLWIKSKKENHTAKRIWLIEDSVS